MSLSHTLHKAETLVAEASICVLRAEVSSAGVALMSQLLQTASPRHLTVDLLKAIEGLCRAARPAEELWQDILGRLLLNLRLWSRADVNTQRYLLQFFVNLAKVARPTPPSLSAGTHRL